jgi:two-component system chemotaxis response regulator CheB
VKLRPIEVVVCDDSAVVRGLLVKALETDPDVHVAGTAPNGQALLRALERTPADVVLLDVEMPVMDGLQALPRILSQFPGLPVIMASAHTREGAATTVEALALGAAGCIAKPTATSVAASIELLTHDLLPLVKAVARRDRSLVQPTGASVETSRSAPAAVRTPAASPRRESSLTRKPEHRPFGGGLPEAIVIGTSTGGPNALSIVATGLASEIEQPIFIVQHMPPLFTPLLAKRLEKDAGRPGAEGVNGQVVQRRRIYVAPGDFHMEVARREREVFTTLHQGPPEHYCRPSVNPLFRTAAEIYGNKLVAVMMTGMGDDGIEGTREIIARGGYVIAQDEASSVVWGMPGAVVREGLAHEVLPLDGIAAALHRVCLRAEIATA